MKTFVAALAAFTILFGGVVAYCQTPLDAPGEKKVTVASEIERGRSEMADAASSSHTLNLLSCEVDLDKVIQRNKAKNTDSDGFILGALLWQWIWVDQMYPTMASNGFTRSLAVWRKKRRVVFSTPCDAFPSRAVNERFANVGTPSLSDSVRLASWS